MVQLKQIISKGGSFEPSNLKKGVIFECVLFKWLRFQLWSVSLVRKSYAFCGRHGPCCLQRWSWLQWVINTSNGCAIPWMQTKHSRRQQCSHRLKYVLYRKWQTSRRHQETQRCSLQVVSMTKSVYLGTSNQVTRWRYAVIVLSRHHGQTVVWRLFRIDWFS